MKQYLNLKLYLFLVTISLTTLKSFTEFTERLLSLIGLKRFEGFGARIRVRFFFFGGGGGGESENGFVISDHPDHAASEGTDESLSFDAA